MSEPKQPALPIVPSDPDDPRFDGALSAEQDLGKCDRCLKIKNTVLVETGFAGEHELLCGQCVSEERAQAEAALAAHDQKVREPLAAWMIANSFATGHGDTTKDLLKELKWQIEERIENAGAARIAALGKALSGDERSRREEEVHNAYLSGLAKLAEEERKP